jgi:hypothetical protein
MISPSYHQTLEARWRSVEAEWTLDAWIALDDQVQLDLLFGSGVRRPTQLEPDWDGLIRRYLAGDATVHALAVEACVSESALWHRIAAERRCPGAGQGRQPLMSPEQRIEARRRYWRGEASMADLASAYGVSKTYMVRCVIHEGEH